MDIISATWPPLFLFLFVNNILGYGSLILRESGPVGCLGPIWIIIGPWHRRPSPMRLRFSRIRELVVLGIKTQNSIHSICSFCLCLQIKKRKENCYLLNYFESNYLPSIYILLFFRSTYSIFLIKFEGSIN